MGLLSRIIGHRHFVLFFELTLSAVAFVFTKATLSSWWIGLVLVSIGAMLFTWGSFYNLPYRGAGLGGPYRFVRYPALLSRFLMLLGLLVLARNPWLFVLAVIVLAPFYRELARTEDQRVLEVLGPLATEYRASVSGFIPQLLPVRQLAWHGSQYQARPSMREVLWGEGALSGYLWIALMFVFVWQYIWTGRLMADWQWRLGAIGIVALFVAVYFKFARRFDAILDRNTRC